MTRWSGCCRYPGVGSNVNSTSGLLRRNSTRPAPSTSADAICSRSRVAARSAPDTAPSRLPLSPDVASTRSTVTPRLVMSSTEPAQKKSTSSGCATMQSARRMRASPGPLNRFGGANPACKLLDGRGLDPSLAPAPQDRARDRVQLGLPAGRDVLLHRAAHVARHAQQGLDEDLGVQRRALRLRDRADLADGRAHELAHARVVARRP